MKAYRKTDKKGRKESKADSITTYRKEDSNGVVWWYDYDSSGNLIHYKSSTGFEEWFDANANVLKHVEGGESREYDSAGRLLRVATPHEETKYSYRYGRVSGMRGSNGLEEDYDDSGNLVHRKHPSGKEEWFSYNRKGKCVHYRDSDGVEWWQDSKPGRKQYRWRKRGPAQDVV